MELFRITKAKYLENYSGRGKSFLEGARWNKAGQPVLYFAQSPSVAQLEMSHYLPSPQLVPKSYRLGFILSMAHQLQFSIEVNYPKIGMIFPILKALKK